MLSVLISWFSLEISDIFLICNLLNRLDRTDFVIKCSTLEWDPEPIQTMVCFWNTVDLEFKISNFSSETSFQVIFYHMLKYAEMKRGMKVDVCSAKIQKAHCPPQCLPQCAVCEFFVSGIKKISKFSIIWICLDSSMWRPGKFLCLFSSPSRVKRDHKRNSHWVRKGAWSECQNNVALDLLCTVVLTSVARRQAWKVCQSWKYQRFRLSGTGTSCSKDG